MKKEAPVFRSLAKDMNATVPVDVTFEGTTAVSKQEINGTYTHTMKLNASGSFSLIKTVSVPSPTDNHLSY